MAGIEPVEDGRPGAPDMEEAGRTGGEAHSYHGDFIAHARRTGKPPLGAPGEKERTWSSHRRLPVWSVRSVRRPGPFFFAPV